jgi:hypothetical protein
VLDRERDVAKRRADPFSFGLETHWPARVVVADHDFHRLASANQNLIEVRVEPVGPSTTATVAPGSRAVGTWARILRGCRLRERSNGAPGPSRSRCAAIAQASC